MSDPNSTSSDILSDGPVKDILRPGSSGSDPLIVGVAVVEV
jgi:hypothetical protein